MDPSKVKTILKWPMPKTVCDVQSFLGFANFYRCFVHNFAAVSKPLTLLMQKDTLFVWSNSCEKSFQTLKSHFNSSSILTHYHPDRQIILETDAFDYVITAIILQIDPSTSILHPILFYSRSLTTAELNYNIYDKELLAIFTAFKEWRHYLEGPELPIEVITDHKNLEYFATTRLLTRCQARWSEYLSGFDFTIQYHPGKQGGKPDALTRRSDVYPQEGEGSYCYDPLHPTPSSPDTPLFPPLPL
jgi:hypothetical protein